jgi:hypothetical protein
MRYQMTSNQGKEVLQAITYTSDMVAEVMDIEPGHHPDIPKKIHVALRSMIASLLYVTTVAEETVLELLQHKLDQDLHNKALLKILIDLGVISADVYQKTLVKIAKNIGEMDVGTA